MGCQEWWANPVNIYSMVKKNTMEIFLGNLYNDAKVIGRDKRRTGFFKRRRLIANIKDFRLPHNYLGNRVPLPPAHRGYGEPRGK